MTFLLAVVLLAEPPAHTVDVFTSPLSIIADATIDDGYLPLGATVRVGDDWGLSIELAGGMMLGDGGAPGFLLSGSFGPTVFFGPDATGPFVTLKAMAQTVTDPEFSPRSACIIRCPVRAPGYAFAGLAGVDVGYQFRHGGLTTAVLLGIAVGWQQNQGSPFTEPMPIGLGTARSSGPAWSLNPNILRIGYQF